MERVELLLVDDCFGIEGWGLVVRPDFSVPNGRWANRSETVKIETPDGGSFEAKADFNLSHINIADPAAPLDRRWRVIVALPGRTKKELPIGSRIWCSREIRDAIMGSDPRTDRTR
jgi:hypothetical protein